LLGVTKAQSLTGWPPASLRADIEKLDRIVDGIREVQAVKGKVEALKGVVAANGMTLTPPAELRAKIDLMTTLSKELVTVTATSDRVTYYRGRRDAYVPVVKKAVEALEQFKVESKICPACNKAW
jgi:hypothetical protein